MADQIDIPQLLQLCNQLLLVINAIEELVPNPAQPHLLPTPLDEFITFLRESSDYIGDFTASLEQLLNEEDDPFVG